MPCDLWDFSSLTRDQTQSPSVKAVSPNHWTTRGFLVLLFQAMLSYAEFLFVQEEVNVTNRMSQKLAWNGPNLSFY